MKSTNAGNKISQIPSILQIDADFASFFNLFLLETPTRENHEVLLRIFDGLKVLKCEKANDQFISFLSNNPEQLEFKYAYHFLQSFSCLKPMTVDIQDFFTSIANHNVLFEKGFIDIEVLIECITGYFRSNSTVGLSSGMIGKIMEFLETMPPDQICRIRLSLQHLSRASGTDNRISQFLLERH